LVLDAASAILGTGVDLCFPKTLKLHYNGRIIKLFINLPERWSLPIGRRIFQFLSVFSALLVLSGVSSATTSSQAKPKHAKVSSTHASSSHHHSSYHASKAVAHPRGQRSIDEERTVAIQSALIREHYLTGEPTGIWDDASKEAMLRYQADNGWQTKITPDSRALIKLGLGPDHKGLLNPETANIPSPHELGIDNQTQPGGAADTE
jgi:hypothetical protein